MLLELDIRDKHSEVFCTIKKEISDKYIDTTYKFEKIFYQDLYFKIIKKEYDSINDIIIANGKMTETLGFFSRECFGTDIGINLGSFTGSLGNSLPR